MIRFDQRVVDGVAEKVALAVFFKRANSWGAVAGTIGGAMVTMIVKNTTDINGYLYGAVGVVSCVLIGLLVSAFMPSRKENVT